MNIQVKKKNTSEHMKKQACSPSGESHSAKTDVYLEEYVKMCWKRSYLIVKGM